MTPTIAGQIEAALSARRWMPRIPAPLRPLYDAEQQANRHGYNTWALITFAIVFDLFLLAQLRSAPELVWLSAMLRLAVLTPSYAAFILRDRRPGLGRLYDPLILVLAVMPVAISAILCLCTTSPSTLSDIRVTPTIILSTGMIWRMGLRTAIANGVLSAVILIAEVIAVCPRVVPAAELGSLIMTDIVIAVTVVCFAVQIERRDRHVFLLATSERLRREALATLNNGLLLENQTDALTGVANRRCFDEALSSAWTDCLKGGRKISLIMIDVDHFKKYNDHYGHQAGDECLRRVAAGGRPTLRAGDVFARYGGEEFAVILPDASGTVAASIAEKIQRGIRALELPHEAVGPNAHVTISLGVATMVPTRQNRVSALIEAADRELYAAKKSGRDKVCHTQAA